MHLYLKSSATLFARQFRNNKAFQMRYPISLKLTELKRLQEVKVKGLKNCSCIAKAMSRAFGVRKGCLSSLHGTIEKDAI